MGRSRGGEGDRCCVLHAGCMFARVETGLCSNEGSFAESRPLKVVSMLCWTHSRVVVPLPTPIMPVNRAGGEAGTQCSQRRNLFLSEGTCF